MRVVDAVWEKRNLGVKTVEIVIEDDSFNQLKSVLEQIDAKYIVLKIPDYCSELCWEVQKAGFVFAEEMIRMVSHLPKLQFSDAMQRMYNSISCQKCTENDLTIILSEVNNGLFGNDRISNDPFFSKDISGKRYSGWLSDEWKRGTTFYKYIYKERMIGFFTIREIEPRVYISTLGGIFKTERRGGIGLINKVPEIVQQLGGKKLYGDVSSNNIEQLKALCFMGYQIHSVNRVFVLHRGD